MNLRRAGGVMSAGAPKVHEQSNESLKLNQDIQELESRYKPVVRDVLIVLSNPDTPGHLLTVMEDEVQFQTRSLLDRLDTHKLETVEQFLPLLMAFEDLNLLAPQQSGN